MKKEDMIKFLDEKIEIMKIKVQRDIGGLEVLEQVKKELITPNEKEEK